MATIVERPGRKPPSDAPAARAAGWIFYTIRGELEATESLLRSLGGNCHPAVRPLVGHAFQLGGKRLRPALVLLSGAAAGGLRREHLVLSAVVELIHAATLVHDDVLDGAEVRRHVPSVNAWFGNRASILTGDLLFSRAFSLAATVDAEACRMIGQATTEVCEGEIRQQRASGNLDLSESEYLAIAESKTASLCACSCRLGARWAGADDTWVERLGEFGRCLGIAFQIADDVLDLVGDEESAGKSLGTDLAQLKLTLPLIHVLSQPALAARARGILTLPPAKRAGELIPILHDSGALEIALAKARHFAALAGEQIGGLAPSAAAEALARLPGMVVDRRS